MFKYLIPLVISICASLALTPLVRALALRLGAIDQPEGRKIHTVPMPRLGGVSIVLSLGLAILVSVGLKELTGGVVPLNREAWIPMALGGTVVFLIGVWDDFRPIPAWLKFLSQVAAAGVAIWFGIRIEHVSFLGGGPYDLGILTVPITLLWIVGVTNAFNLVDGLDGLATGLALIAAGTIAAIFLLGGDAPDALFLVILFGVLAGFLLYNFNPATIFLGDSGSLVIGFIFAIIAVTGSQKQATTLAALIPLLVLGLPITDTLLSMVRRFVGSLSLVQPYKAPLKERIRCVRQMFKADQKHIHHRLLAKGLSHRNAVLVLYTFALGLSLLAFLSVLAQYRNAGIILITVGLATGIGLGKLGYKELPFLRAGALLRWCEQFTFHQYFFLGFIDIVLITAAYWGAFVLKHEFTWTGEVKEWYLGSFPMVMLIQMGVFFAFGLYRGVWRAMGIGDLIRIGTAVGAGVALSYIVAVISMPPGNGTFTFFCIDFLLFGMLAAGVRSTYRVLHYVQQRQQTSGKQVLIYGAGHSGQLLLHKLLQNINPRLRPVGFIDDEPTLWGRTVNRMPVLGPGNDLASFLENSPVAALLISSSKIDSNRLNMVIRLCRERQIQVLRCNLLHFEPMGADGGVSTVRDRKSGHRSTLED